MLSMLLASSSFAQIAPCELPVLTIGDATELYGNHNDSTLDLYDNATGAFGGDGLVDQNRVMVPSTGPLREELVVILPGFGVQTSQLTRLIESGARAGFLTIALAWDNDQVTFMDCQDWNSTDADVDACITGERITRQRGNILQDGIEQLLSSVLLDLDAAYPAQNVGRWLGPSGIEWADTVVAGYSEGGNQAAWIAVNTQLRGAFLVSGGLDYGVDITPAPGTETLADLASWMFAPPLTDPNNILALYHTDEDAASAIGLGLDVFGVPVTVRNPVPQTLTWWGWTQHRLETDVVDPVPATAACGPHSRTPAGTTLGGEDCAELNGLGDHKLSQAHMYGLCRAAL